MLFPPGPPIANNIAAYDTLVGMTSPSQIAYDPIRDVLWVADSGGNQILRFDNISANIPPLVQQLSSLNVVVNFQGATPNLNAFPKGKLHFFLNMK